MSVPARVKQNGTLYNCNITHVMRNGVPVEITNAVPNKATVPPPDPPKQKFRVFAATSNASGGEEPQMDQVLANHIGTTTPLLYGAHNYSGNNFPATVQQSSAWAGIQYGFPASILNVKCDWNGLANGSFDSRIIGFCDSIPQGHRVYLIINHEPENDNNPAGAGVWRNGQARAGNLIAQLNDDRLHFAVCHMAYTWHTSSRNPNDWNPANGPTIQMTQAAKDRTVFAPDGYTDVRSNGTVQTMASEFDAVWASARAWGFKRFGISEHAITNPTSHPTSVVVNHYYNDVIPYLRGIPELEYYALFPQEIDGLVGVHLDTPAERTMFANLCLEQNR